MAIVKKSSGANGPWVDKTKVKSGTKVKIVTECVPTDEEYQGKVSTRHVVKLKVQGDDGEPKNFDINRPSVNGLIDAFGEDTKAWIGQTLTAETMRVIVGGKMGTAMYLVPEGFEFTTDAGGYAVVQRIGAAQTPIAPTPAEPHVPTGKFGDHAPIEYPDEEINPADIPF